MLRTFAILAVGALVILRFAPPPGAIPETDPRVVRINAWRETARCMRSAADSMLSRGVDHPAPLQAFMLDQCGGILRPIITRDYPAWTQDEITEMLGEQARTTLWTIYQERKEK